MKQHAPWASGGGGGVTLPPPPIIFPSRHLEPQSANEASKVLEVEQWLVQNKFAVGKPRAVGLPTGFANVLCNSILLQFQVAVSKKWLRYRYPLKKKMLLSDKLD